MKAFTLSLLSMGIASIALAQPSAMSETSMDTITAAGLTEELHAFNLPDGLISRIQTALNLGNSTVTVLRTDDASDLSATQADNGFSQVFQSNTNINDNGRATTRSITILNGQVISDITTSR